MSSAASEAGLVYVLRIVTIWLLYALPTETMAVKPLVHVAVLPDVCSALPVALLRLVKVSLLRYHAPYMIAIDLIDPIRFETVHLLQPKVEVLTQRSV